MIPQASDAIGEGSVWSLCTGSDPSTVSADFGEREIRSIEAGSPLRRSSTPTASSSSSTSSTDQTTPSAAAPISNEDPAHEANESAAQEAAEDSGQFHGGPGGMHGSNEDPAHEANESAAQEAAEDAAAAGGATTTP